MIREFFTLMAAFGLRGTQPSAEDCESAEPRQTLAFVHMPKTIPLKTLTAP